MVELLESHVETTETEEPKVEVTQPELEVIDSIPEPPEIKTFSGIPVMEQDLGFYKGMIPVMLPEVENPQLAWQGPKVPAELWRQIVSFMRYTHSEITGEAQLRLFINDDTGEWKAVVMPQWVKTGLSSQEIENHAKRDEALSVVNSAEGWREAGTVHHHCGCGAFQSMTDWKDEIDKNGVHVTLGYMSRDKLDIDSRVSFRHIMYGCDPLEWIDVEHVDDLTKAYDDRFPDVWKTYLYEKPKPVVRKVVGNSRWWEDYKNQHNGKTVNNTGNSTPYSKLFDAAGESVDDPESDNFKSIYDDVEDYNIDDIVIESSLQSKLNELLTDEEQEEIYGLLDFCAEKMPVDPESYLWEEFLEVISKMLECFNTADRFLSLKPNEVVKHALAFLDEMGNYGYIADYYVEMLIENTELLLQIREERQDAADAAALDFPPAEEDKKEEKDESEADTVSVPAAGK